MVVDEKFTNSIRLMNCKIYWFCIRKWNIIKSKVKRLQSSDINYGLLKRNARGMSLFKIDKSNKNESERVNLM